VEGFCEIVQREAVGEARRRCEDGERDDPGVQREPLSRWQGQIDGLVHLFPASVPSASLPT